MNDLNPLFAIAIGAFEEPPTPVEPRGKKGRMYDPNIKEEEEVPTHWRQPLFRTHPARVGTIRR